MSGPSNKPLPVWAGIECTVNRVGDRYFDQLVRTGHHDRSDDIERIAALGVRTMRYPVLWERTAPGALADADWSWPDERLALLRANRIEPIVGLLHHGSGPAHTSLLDDRFPEQLGSYAAAVAERYPWIDAFTPVNEPLTTARFSGLYGHWYPHARSDHAFARALLGQCKATTLAMAAIRRVNPAARLVTTEDLGMTHSTRALDYQALFENERRWLSLDLICGKVDAYHPLRGWLRSVGIPEADLDWFVDHPCRPDVIGCNYYVTSERYLDEDLLRWPESERGGNGRHRYADVAAARACGLAGLSVLLRACHARYGLPVAVTEAHLGCTLDEQMRWLLLVYDEATRARAAGVPVRAVTAWAALGSYDWHCLVTRDEGRYEAGLFDVRGPVPLPTGLAALVRALASGRRPEAAELGGRGWWEHASRETGA